MNRSLPFAAALLAAVASIVVGCNGSATKPAPDGAAPASGLTAEQAGKVVAVVGDRTITLGDFAKTLERMEQFDRLRYQTKERRRDLLNEMINVELLAAEARKRGLDKDPEVDDQVRVVLRDAMLAKAREGVPAPAQISQEEIASYYAAHTDKFSEPERRRVAAIVMADKNEALKVLKEALKAKTQQEWGELFFKHSMTAPKTRSPSNPAELAGDLGIVSPPDDPKGGNAAVPPAVRAVVFKLPGVGSVATELVEADGKQFIVRLNGLTAGHRRTPAEAERSIRVILVQDKIAEKEKALEAELRKKFPVEVDDKALAAVKLPSGMDRWFEMDAKMWPSPPGEASDGGAPGSASDAGH